MQSAEGSPPNQDNFSNTAAETLKSLENLISESLQIYELYNQKENITDELVNSLRIITEYLSFSVNIHPGIFGLSTNSNIILLPTLEIIIREPNGKTEQKRLDQFAPDKITKILEYVIPLFLNMIQSEKVKLTEKISFLREATSQLKELQILKHAENLKQNIPLEGATNQNV
jgi:hypothetical protein